MRKTKEQIPGVIILPEALVGVLWQITHGGKRHLMGGPRVSETVIAHQIRLNVMLDVTNDVLLDAVNNRKRTQKLNLKQNL